MFRSVSNFCKVDDRDNKIIQEEKPIMRKSYAEKCKSNFINYFDRKRIEH